MHLDVKPSNLLIDENFRAKVADFGLSNSRETVGSPLWMAPEVLLGETPTTAADVFSFAVVMYEIFARRQPYEGKLQEGCRSNIYVTGYERKRSHTALQSYKSSPKVNLACIEQCYISTCGVLAQAPGWNTPYHTISATYIWQTKNTLNNLCFA